MSTQDTHHHITINTVPDKPSDHTTSQPDMRQQDVKTDKDRGLWGKIYYKFKVFCDQHKRVKPLGEAPSVGKSILAIIKMSWLNVLLIFIPLSWIFHFVKFDNTLVFVFSFLAIIPLAKLQDFVADELSLRLGQTLAGLLNTTLGNAVELIVAIIALVKCELTVVQSSLIGSILSKLLLVLGMCFFAGGTRFSEQGFGVSAAQLNSTLLTLSVIAVLLPAAFHNAVESSNGVDPLTAEQESHDILSISHVVAIILLFIYLCYLVFQLFSHKNLYEDQHMDVQRSIKYNPAVGKKFQRGLRKGGGLRHRISKPTVADHPAPSPPRQSTEIPDTENPQRDAGLVEAASIEEFEEDEVPQMDLRTTVVLFIVVPVVVAITAEFLVDSIDGLTRSGHISKGFVGLILLPIVGNSAELATAVTVSVKDKLTLSLGVAVGSSIQIALFVIPFMVTLGWILGKPLTLLFDPFESIVLFLSVSTVNYVVQDGKSHWLDGMILMCLYAIIGVVFWYYPVSDPAGILATCK